MDIDTSLVIKKDMGGVRVEVLKHIDQVAKFTGTDVFLLNPKPEDPEDASAGNDDGSNQRLNNHLRISIYGDTESSEHAKTRLLIMIDQIVSFWLL